jgi:hypothetical protein
VTQSVEIALAAMSASSGLDADRSKMYVDLILNALTEAAYQALQAMNPANYEYQSEFAKRYYSQGIAEGEAELLIKLLVLKYGPLVDATKTQLRLLSSSELDKVADRILTAATIEDALNVH